MPANDPTGMPALSQQNTQRDQNPFPNNFGFTTPEVHLMDNLPTAHLPYDVLDFMRDTDFLLDEIDTLDFDFNAGLPSFPQGPAPIGERQHLNRDGSGNLQQQEGTVSRIEAFKKSPWFWKPSSAQNAFSDHPRIPLESENVDVAASPHWPYSIDLIIQDKLNQQTRDRILQLVIQTVGTRVESDNSVIRDLQYLQAYMIWLDIGIWCGYKRKMEIAESHFQPLCTALRKAGAFDKSFYKRIIPSSDDDDATLEGKWRQWVEQESYKRLVYHLFEHDVQVAFSMTRNPLTSFSEFSVPFPAERDIWLAPTPSAWRAIHLSKVRAPDPVFNSLKDMLMKPDRLNALSGDADFNMSTSIFVHGIGALVWDYRKQASITQETQSHDDPTAHLWMQSRRQDLHQLLQTIQAEHKRTPAVLALLIEFLQMYLHASLDDIQRFAGKYGEDEARRSFAVLDGWSRARAARAAVWHAGQVLKAARAVPPYQLRGFDSISIYYATLALWVYAVLHCRRGRGGGDDDDAGLQGGTEAPLVHLDGLRTREVTAFLTQDAGTPVLGLRDGAAPCFVRRQPGQVMLAGAQVLEGNYPNSGRDELPPMIMSLRDLMRDLGGLS
ncbi:hypothetical protein SLS57_004048 [Botryosphaeria dothidea]